MWMWMKKIIRCTGMTPGRLMGQASKLSDPLEVIAQPDTRR